MTEENHKIFRSKAIQSSFWVVLFSGLNFFGFFLRDYFMAGFYGFGPQLDAFYLSSMIPMFLVAVFCIPFGNFAVSRLQKIKIIEKNRLSQIFQNYAFAIFLLCLFLCFLSYTISDLFFSATNYKVLTENSINIKFMQLGFLPILLFSGLIILGNAILCINERYIYPIAIQLIVPLFSIFFLVFLGKVYGVYAVILGMVLGQITNLIIVNYVLKRDGINFLPLGFSQIFFEDSIFSKEFGYLCVVALFFSILIPLNTIIASTLGGGAVSIFNIGTKFTLFIMSIISTLFTTILLPYLTKISTYKNRNIINKETFYLSFFSILFFIPFCLLIFIYADLISKVIFSSIIIENATILGLGSVIKYNIIQLPFLIFSAIIFKHATALGRVEIILFSSLIMFVSNIFLGLSLIKFMNVGGISLALSISSAIAAVIILIYYIFKKHLRFSQGIIILTSWFVFFMILIKLKLNSFLMLLEKLI
jgi:putative peptidoglycan lipid II flippase